MFMKLKIKAIEKHNMLNCWFSLASVLFLLTANASEDPNASLIVPYQFDMKRFHLSQSNNITGFCYNNSFSLGYWCSVEDEGSPYLTTVPHVYKEFSLAADFQIYSLAWNSFHRSYDSYLIGYTSAPLSGFSFAADFQQTNSLALNSFQLELFIGGYISEPLSFIVPFEADFQQTTSLALDSFRGLVLIAGFTTFFCLLLVVVFGVYSSVKKHKYISHKSKIFKKNGGLLLEQHIASHGPGSGGTQIFTAEELEMATEYYYNKKNHTFTQEAGASSSTYGTSYKKLSSADNVIEMVFVKEKVLVEEGQIELFINEIITLTQINHQNVIKLLGCCLETEAPILVYEFASNGTLFDYIHHGTNAMPHWDILLEIASESAAGLAYLHSLSIIHGNVKSSNILLTDCLAKVAGFRPPRLIPSNESQISTLVQRTLGYLDPQYLLTGQLTDKSDVYSFGVILIEILTGEKPICFNRPENRRIITSHFLLSMELQNGLFHILAPQVKEENKEQVGAVAELAKRCLKLNSAERPTMEEVAGELKRLSDTYLTVHVN